MFGRRRADGVRRVRLATWNIRHGAGIDGEVDLERVADTLRSLRAEVVGLQELDRGWARSRGEDQPVRLAELMAMEVIFEPTLREEGREYGLALASSRPISARFEALPRREGEEPRGVLVGRTQGLTVLVTHLSRHETSRRLQVERLAALVAAAPPPVVLLGDLNEGRRGLAPLRRAGLRGPWRRRPTVPAHRPMRQIDHVLAGDGARVEKVWTVPTAASDHRPLVASLAVTGDHH